MDVKVQHGGSDGGDMNGHLSLFIAFYKRNRYIKGKETAIPIPQQQGRLSSIARTMNSSTSAAEEKSSRLKPIHKYLYIRTRMCVYACLCLLSRFPR